MPSRRLGLLCVDLRLLEELLRLPAGVRITGVQRPRPSLITNGDEQAAFIVEGDHPGLYEVPSGAVIPFIRLDEVDADDPNSPRRILR